MAVPRGVLAISRLVAALVLRPCRHTSNSSLTYSFFQVAEAQENESSSIRKSGRFSVWSTTDSAVLGVLSEKPDSSGGRLTIVNACLRQVSLTSHRPTERQ